MKPIDEVVNFITNIIKGVLNGDYTDVPKVQLYRYYTESVVISLLNSKRLRLLESDNLAILDEMSELGLLSADIPLFYKDHRKLIESALQFDSISDSSSVHLIHEGLLSRELNISKKNVWFSVDKISRDNTGSYYTPGDLALEVVREAIKKYLNTNTICNKADATRLLEQTKFADLSCGCGEFIKAVRTELIEQYDIEPERVCLNIYGIDIDPIALQITICDLLCLAPQDSWREIISHFVLGNPLIDQSDEKDYALKTRLYATGRFYNSDMGINIERLFSNACIGIVVGNPPWEKVRCEERKFFKPICPEISAISQKDKRLNAIENLKEQAPRCYEWYRQVFEDYSNFRNEAKKHPFISDSLNGELNTYMMFTELSLNIIAESGVLTLLVKSAIATSPVNKPFFSQIVKRKSLVSVCLFNNSLRIFNIDSRERFCVITCARKAHASFELIAGATKVEDLNSIKPLSLTAKDMSVVNPYTQMLPNISKNADMQILLTAHRRLPLFDAVYPGCHYGRLVHLTSHAQHINTVSTDSNMPVYEGKFIERYSARFSTFADMHDAQKYSAKASAKKTVLIDGEKPLPESRYFIQKEFWKKLSANYVEPHMLCWRSLTSTTNARTTLAMLLPTMPTSQSIQFLQTSSVADLLIMLALLNSKPFDFLVRLKMPGIDLTQSVVRQIPIPSRNTYQQLIQFSNIELTLEQHIIERATAILISEPMLATMLESVECPPEKVQKKTKPTLEKELDDLFFIAYGFSHSERNEILGTFKK